MGRRSNASKLVENSNLLEHLQMNSFLERNESQPDVVNLCFDEADLQPNAHFSRKRKMNPTTAVRRSQRIVQNTIVQKSSNASKLEENSTMHILQTVTESGEENEDEPFCHEEEELPEPSQEERSIEEKLESISRLLEAQEKVIEALKSKESEATCHCQMPDESPCVADTRYKSMYLDSQKKIEALADENRQLALKLERALGKLEVYESKSHAHAYPEMLDKLKDFIAVANLSKFTESTQNGQQAFSGLLSPPPPPDCDPKDLRTDTVKRRRVGRSENNAN